MEYKNAVKNKKLRIQILKFLSFIPDRVMIKLQYKISTGKKLNLKNPMTFNEKMQLYKLKYRNKLMITCADKFAVRSYVKHKGLEHILNELYSVSNNYKEIDFDSLPQKFVLKVTNGSGTNFLCSNKYGINFHILEKQINEWMKPTRKSPGREWAYESIIPRIICEKYLDTGPNGDLRDYKFFCFNGEPKYVQVDINRFTNHKRNLYDADWNFINENITYSNVGDTIEKPETFDEMLKIARILSSDFPHVRVDLYDYNGKVIFGELTFYHGSGYEKFSSTEFELEMGRHFSFPK